MKNLFTWLQSSQKQCAHRFEFNQVIDLNITANSIACLHCKKTFGELANKKTRWQRFTGKSAQFYYIEKEKNYGIQFVKPKK